MLRLPPRGPSSNCAPAPGTHGHGLLSVAVGSTTLQPSPAVNRIPSSAGSTFDVKFQNQGQNDEIDVRVIVTITGGTKPITGRKTINQTKAGAQADATIPLGTTPPVGQPVTITAQVAAVPGEKNLTNNKQTYTAIFQR